MDRVSGRPVRLPYLPALDGLRGVAVAAVLLFHSDLDWMKGGHLGVTAFFTLSGFLITALLLVERQSTGTVDLKAFWGRRAKRLVPGVVVCFGLVALGLALSEDPTPSGVLGDALGAATWVANWRFIFDGQSYADLFSAPSPFQHFWSLAVEEQFYLAFPLLVAAVLGLRGQGMRRKAHLAVVLVVLAAGSTFMAAHLHDPSRAVARAYYGTDARIAELLVGALLAMVLVGPSGLRTITSRWRWLVDGIGAVGLVGLVTALVVLGDHDTRLYEGGFLAVALCTAALIAAVVQPRTGVGRLLGIPPAVALGKVSYGAYLFHWPVFLLLTERSTGLEPASLFGVRVALTIALAALSYTAVEAPIRFGHLPTGVGLTGWANGAVAGIACVALAAGVIAPAGGSTSAAAGPDGGAAAAAAPTGPVTSAAPPTAATSGPARATAAPVEIARTAPGPRAAEPPAPAGFFDDPGKTPTAPAPQAPPDALRIAVVGDSIGGNLGHGLELWARERTDVVVYNVALPACPVSRGGDRRFAEDDDIFPVHPACGWWDEPSSERRTTFEKFAPDVVVVQDGINEMVDRKLADWPDWRRPGQVSFDSWLRQEYAAAFDGWTALGARVVVTNAPCADWERYPTFRQIEDPDLRIGALNVNVYSALVGVTVADLFQRLCPAGQYSDEVEGVEQGRPDGFHLSDEAALALARNWLGPIILDSGPVQPPLPID